ncbi:class I SAM-dependent methyltransferase [Helicobacter cinaedi]|uniref:class I SAM-dependent methyltransferase n=1 Tax=Helicobacter cinaedi TaxID=213 RepID=UPI000CF06216|nr:class I SAM-dependent methyltransferase [Helicobacter cinaedi]
MKHKITQDSYLSAAQMDKQSTKNYFAKSVNKTEQQKALESLLVDSINKGELDGNAPYRIADLACGGGTLSYHLSSFFPNASFVLVDYNEYGLELAKEINTESKDRMEFIQGDLRDLPLQDSHFDLVFCSQTFLIFDEKALQPIINEVHRILKPNGKLYASSLFNTEFDVDIVCDFKDLTRESGKAGIWGRYTTFSLPTMQGILQNFNTFTIHPFIPQIDFPRTTHRGIATYSVKVLQDSHLIQVDENFGGAFVGETNSDENTSVPRRALGAEAEFTSAKAIHRGTQCSSDENVTGGGQNTNCMSHNPTRLQISAGMLMNWGILEATK